MSTLRDLLYLYRARPLRCLCCSLVGGCLGLAIGTALLHGQRNASELYTLLELWPRGHTTLQLTPDTSWADYLRLTGHLPEGHWTASRVEGDITWVDGSLTESFRDQEGRTLLPNELAQGTPYGLSTKLATGESLYHEETRFNIMGQATGFASTPHVLPLRAGRNPERPPSHIRVRHASDRLKPRLMLSATTPLVTMIDHEARRGPLETQLRSLRLRTAASLSLSSFLAAMVLITLITSDYMERQSEFALRRVLGATPAHLHQQLLTESLVLSGLPLIIGLLIFLPHLALATLLTALAVSVALMLLLAALPAAHAANRPPVVGLQRNT